MENDLILVSGASGYLASHIVKQLLEQDCRVRGTVRSLKDEKKISPLRKLIENPKYPLELVEANLLEETSWINAVKDCTYVIHTASPFPNSVPRDETELTVPAVNGTLNVLKASCMPGSTVKRVVLTSSIAAIFGDIFSDGQVFNENNWPELINTRPYSKSKTLAERAAWNFVNEKKKNNESCFELAVINPGYIMGPLLHDSDCTSMEVIKKLLERQVPLLPNLNFCTCDVRDVATAHIRAMTIAEAANNRHIIASTEECNSMLDYALILDEEFSSKGYNVPTKVAPNIFVKFASVFDKSIALITPMLGKKFRFENNRMINVLQIQPIALKKTIIDMANNLIEKGKISK